MQAGELLLSRKKVLVWLPFGAFLHWVFRSPPIVFSIYSLRLCKHPWLCCNRSRRETLTSFNQQHSPAPLVGSTGPKRIHNPSIKFWVCPRVSFLWDIKQKTSRWRPPGTISSTPSSPWMMEVWSSISRLFSAVCIRDLCSFGHDITTVSSHSSITWMLD